MTSRSIEDARAVIDPAALGIIGAEDKLSDAGMGNRPSAHRARLQRDVQIASGEPGGILSFRSLSDHQHLRMCGRVLQFLDPVAVFGQDLARRPVDQDRADRRFSAPGSLSSLLKRADHIWVASFLHGWRSVECAPPSDKIAGHDNQRP